MFPGKLDAVNFECHMYDQISIVYMCEIDNRTGEIVEGYTWIGYMSDCMKYYVQTEGKYHKVLISENFEVIFPLLRTCSVTPNNSLIIHIR